MGASDGPSRFDLRPGSVLAARYRIGDALGAGGSGEVYEATDLRTGGQVALKILSGAARAVDVSRFERQPLATARVEHEAIVRMLDAGVHDGRPFVVMERLQGASLAAVIRRRGRLEVELAARLGAEIASAVRAVHRNGVIHRDLKPSNVWLVADGDGREHAKVLDFGIAKIESAGASLTDTGEVFGSTHYMAPEQLRDAKAVDDRSDIYAIGCIVYEMLTGRPPFDAPTRTELVLSVLGDPPPAVCSLRPEVPAALQAAIERALAKNPRARFANAASLARALEQSVAERGD